MSALMDSPPKLDFPAPLGASGKPEEAPSGDKAPKPRRGRPPGSSNKPAMSIGRIETALNEQFSLIGTFVYPFNQYDGQVILEGTPRLAKALANLCDRNPTVKRNIERILAGGSYGEVIIAAALIAVPIMANHGMMPPGVRNMYGAAIPPNEDTPQQPDE